jgi:uncharacterized protein YecT (DUF1311 family)
LSGVALHEDLNRCNAEAQGTAGRRQCLATVYKNGDIALNAVYRRLLAQCGGDRRAALTEAQRRWLAYRDAELALVHQLHQGGTLEWLAVDLRRTILTVNRVAELEDYTAEAGASAE